jgi:hypothetical protein
MYYKIHYSRWHGAEGALQPAGHHAPKDAEGASANALGTTYYIVASYLIAIMILLLPFLYTFNSFFELFNFFSLIPPPV